mmetsp:Transcript_53161/g.119332  ORF Transcript_53161/g.119332 Transcript_53161/m.119332 type:complete len:307 (-) Transcript_53161:440-1360(-)
MAQGQTAIFPGLSSPGPIYALPSSFEKAKTVSKHPTWGQHGSHSLKNSRSRCEEVRFYGRHHMRELAGHFSPGPQYNLPTTVGGGVANFKAFQSRLASTAPANGGRVKLTQSHLEGPPSYTLTRGSFSDCARLDGTLAEPMDVGTAYWRRATMLQPKETNPINSGVRPDFARTWNEGQETLADTKTQRELIQELKTRQRPPPRMPLRQTMDKQSDPPFASVFGSVVSHTDFGVLGGMDTAWKESKVQGYQGGGITMGKPPQSGHLRYAFIQTMGPGSVPRDSIVADVDGGRITKFFVERPKGASLH